MTEYASDIKEIKADTTVVYNKLSNLKNIEAFKDMIPANVGVKDIRCEADSISFNVNPVGDVTLRIIEKEEPKTIKFAADNSPVAMNFWIQLVNKGENDTKLRLTLRVDIPMMIKMMVDSKLKDGINKLADVLANIKYD